MDECLTEAGAAEVMMTVAVGVGVDVVGGTIQGGKEVGEACV